MVSNLVPARNRFLRVSNFILFFCSTHFLDKPPKKATVLIQLLSTAGTGFFYTARKNPRTVQRKLAFRKYDPIVRRHVLFEEKKLPSGKKR